MATNQHDPFSFGQVRLGKEPASGAVEDLLFSQPSGNSADAARDTSWDPPPQFADEIELSSQPSTFDAPTPEQQQKREVASSLPRLDSHNVIRPESRPAQADVAFHEAAIPAAVFLVVESLAAYAWASMEQPVLAALGAFLGCGLAAFAWFAVRR